MRWQLSAAALYAAPGTEISCDVIRSRKYYAEMVWKPEAKGFGPSAGNLEILIKWCWALETIQSIRGGIFSLFHLRKKTIKGDNKKFPGASFKGN